MADNKTKKKSIRDWNAFSKRPFPKGYSAAWLKHKRKSAALTLRAVAEVAEVHYVTVWAWEHGKSCPTQKQFAKISRLFEKSA
jgi:DNA-binding XRE family transcriptional regulator